eukprot:jgi/Bigna1/132588/aug1.18_g7296
MPTPNLVNKQLLGKKGRAALDTTKMKDPYAYLRRFLQRQEEARLHDQRNEYKLERQLRLNNKFSSRVSSSSNDGNPFDPDYVLEEHYNYFVEQQQPQPSFRRPIRTFQINKPLPIESNLLCFPVALCSQKHMNTRDIINARTRSSAIKFVVVVVVASFPGYLQRLRSDRSDNR